MSKRIYLLCGPPGSGKSTWAKAHYNPVDGVIISRDKIRFSLVKEDEEYFSKENQVFSQFVSAIRWAMDTKDYKEVYIDATHLTRQSRDKILFKLNLTNTLVIPVVFRTSLSKCLEWNSGRIGRTRVPDDVVTNMYNSFVEPTFKESIRYNKIIYVHENGSEVEVSNE
jgi:predicted kinase